MKYLLFGAADEVLLFAIAVRSFGHVGAGIAAALLLLVTPAHAFSVTASPDGIRPLPFMLGWALAMTGLVDPPSWRRSWLLAAGVASLLASAVAYPSTALMIPVFGAATAVTFLRANSWRARNARPALSALVMLLVVVLVVSVAAAGSFQESPPASHGAAPIVEWLRTVAWQRAATVSRWFWNFYLPSHLYLNPEAPGRSGMFLTATVIPMAAGIHTLYRADAAAQRFAPLRVMVAAACIGAPLTAAITSHPPLDDRALIVVPFGVLLAVCGSIRMWTSGLAGRVLLVAVYLAAAVQAVVFLKST